LLDEQQGDRGSAPITVSTPRSTRKFTQDPGVLNDLHLLPLGTGRRNRKLTATTESMSAASTTTIATTNNTHQAALFVA